MKVTELAGWVGLAIGVGLGAAAMYWWPIAVLLLILGACGIIVALVMEPGK